MIHDDWHGLYREGWGKEITPDAYAHPAKFARGLIRRIYDHLIEQGYVKPGDTILDPFGGVALGALEATLHGCDWIGVELEAKFVALGTENIALWERRYRKLFPNMGRAVLLQGDSRQLGAVVRGAVQGCVSSPPYAETAVEKSSDGVDLRKQWQTYRAQGGGMGYDAFCEQQRRHAQGYGNSDGQLAAMKPGDLRAVITSPPFGEGETRDRAPVQDGDVADCMTRAYTQDRQGTTPGNLATMETSDQGLKGVVSSPPFMETGTGGTNNVINYNKQAVSKNRPEHLSQENRGLAYGTSPGQLGRMPEGEHAEAPVSSPPYEASRTDQEFQRQAASGVNLSMPETTKGYGDSGIGRERTQEAIDDFWHAARQIVDECCKLLAPGAVAVWVVKRFVRNKQIVPFPDQWRQMCEAAGFETIEWIRAWVVEEHGEQLDLFGNGHAVKKERKSFFRRLYESKYPENAIDWEDVIVMRKVA